MLLPVFAPLATEVVRRRCQSHFPQAGQPQENGGLDESNVIWCDG